MFINKEEPRPKVKVNVQSCTFVRAEHFQRLHGLETLIIHVELVSPQWEIVKASRGFSLTCTVKIC